MKFNNARLQFIYDVLEENNSWAFEENKINCPCSNKEAIIEEFKYLDKHQKDHAEQISQIYRRIKKVFNRKEQIHIVKNTNERDFDASSLLKKKGIYLPGVSAYFHLATEGTPYVHARILWKDLYFGNWPNNFKYIYSLSHKPQVGDIACLQFPQGLGGFKFLIGNDYVVRDVSKKGLIRIDPCKMYLSPKRFIYPIRKRTKEEYESIHRRIKEAPDHSIFCEIYLTVEDGDIIL
jgi:hypothetical protein